MFPIHMTTDPAGMIQLPGRLVDILTRHGHFDNIAGIVIRMIIVGALVAGVRKFWHWSSIKITRGKPYHLATTNSPDDQALFPTAYVAVSDASYLWIMAWIATNAEAQKQIRDFQLSTSEWRQVRRRSGNALRAKEGGAVGGVGEQNATWSSKEIIGQVIPTYRTWTAPGTSGH
jgi:chaperone BCS1